MGKSANDLTDSAAPLIAGLRHQIAEISGYD